MRHVFIVNPAAGKRRSARALEDRVRAAFPGEPYEFHITAAAGDARAIAAQAVAEGGPVRLYACGGDGTLNEVVNAAAGCHHAAVTNVPLGTGNDFLRIFGKAGRKRFADIAALKDGPQRALDLIDCNGQLGVDIVCAGIDARTAAEVHRFKSFGSAAYAIALFSVAAKGLTFPMEVHMGPISYTGPTTLLCVCSGQYYGGGFRPMPEAVPDDGVLDMLLVRDLTPLQFLRCVGTYAKGRYRRCPQLIQAWHGDRATLSSQQEMVAVVDGEVMRASRFEIGLSPLKLNFFVPAGVDFPAPQPIL